MPNFVDGAVECIKVLVDKNRCGTCDSLKTTHLRYQCGHWFCDDCVAKVGECLLCLTPPLKALPTPVPDNPGTQRANDVAELLQTFQEAFCVDVYLRSRLSEQLKVEKDIFPECIQAAVKYQNKRKSSVSQSNKENSNLSVLQGELISPTKAAKMENSLKYVKHWLDNNEMQTPKKSPRRPFADLNVNSPVASGIRKRANLILDKVKEKERTPKKKKLSSFKSPLAVVQSQSLLDPYLKPIKKDNIIQRTNKDQKEYVTDKCNVSKVIDKLDKDESGIVIDDEPIVIDDSQSQVVDKDKQAWMAVLEAELNSPYVSISVPVENSTAINSYDKVHNSDTDIIESLITNKVPFYKRSYLTETCYVCKRDQSKLVTRDKVADRPKDVSITIESKSFVSTIKVSTLEDEPISEKRSVPVQTDVCDIANTVEAFHTSLLPVQFVDVISNYKITALKNEKDVCSEDLFTAEAKNMDKHKSKLLEKAVKNPTQVVISDSDSDDANESSIILVTAEVHHSKKQEEGLLSELDESEVQQRAKRSGRGLTPHSSCSSEKENFDPNKPKRKKPNKKEIKKCDEKRK